MLEAVERALGRGENLDAEAMEQGARAKGVGSQRLGDGVVIEVSRLAFEPDGDTEDLGENPIEPQPARRAAEQLVILGQDAPGFA